MDENDSACGDEDGHKPLLMWMKQQRIPITREAYLALAYPDRPPDEWTAELEAQLPASLQRPFTPEGVPAADSDTARMNCYTQVLEEDDKRLFEERAQLISRLLERCTDKPAEED